MDELFSRDNVRRKFVPSRVIDGESEGDGKSMDRPEHVERV